MSLPYTALAFVGGFSVGPPLRVLHPASRAGTGAWAALHPYLPVTLGVLALGALIVTTPFARRLEREDRWLLLLMVVPGLGPLAASAVLVGYRVRYALPALPFVLLWAASGLGSRVPRLATAGLAALVVVEAWGLVQMNAPAYEREDARSAAAWVEARPARWCSSARRASPSSATRSRATRSSRSSRTCSPTARSRRASPRPLPRPPTSSSSPRARGRLTRRARCRRCSTGGYRSARRRPSPASTCAATRPEAARERARRGRRRARARAARSPRLRVAAARPPAGGVVAAVGLHAGHAQLLARRPRHPPPAHRLARRRARVRGDGAAAPAVGRRGDRPRRRLPRADAAGARGRS